MSEYKLSDFTGALPKRRELGEIANNFGTVLKYNSNAWTKKHYQLIDNLFLHRSPFAYHYAEFMKALPSDKARKQFKGTILNQFGLLMMVHLDSPQPQRGRAETAVWFGLSVARATFIRKFFGVKKTGKLDHCPMMNANMKQFDWEKPAMAGKVNMLYDIMMKRGEYLLPKWRKTEYYKENYML